VDPNVAVIHKHIYVGCCSITLHEYTYIYIHVYDTVINLKTQYFKRKHTGGSECSRDYNGGVKETSESLENAWYVYVYVCMNKMHGMYMYV
jgi:hypothetical protein